MPIRDKEKKKVYDKTWIARRRAEFFSDKKCTWCESVVSLELDHLDPTKKVANSIWSWSKERRDIEIAKCIVLCHTCHKSTMPIL